MRHERSCDCIVCEIQRRPRAQVRRTTASPAAVRTRRKPAGPGPRPPKDPGEKRTRKPGSGRKSTVPPAMAMAIARALLEGEQMRAIARKAGCTYEQVRTVKRNQKLWLMDAR